MNENFVLECRECGRRRAFESSSEVLNSDEWFDISNEGRLDTRLMANVVKATCERHVDRETEDTSWSPDIGSTVDIAQASLPSQPRNEHRTGEIRATHVNVRMVGHRSDDSPMSAIISEVLEGKKSNANEICTYRRQEKHNRTTYYNILFDNGTQGIYPEESLVPTPEEILDDHTSDSTGSSGGGGDDGGTDGGDDDRQRIEQ